MALDGVQSLLAVDINDLALRKVAAGAAQLGLQNKLRFLSGNFYELSWKSDDFFDVVVCMDVLHHLPDIPRMLGIIRGRLKQAAFSSATCAPERDPCVFFERYGPVKRWLIRIQPGRGPDAASSQSSAAGWAASATFESGRSARRCRSAAVRCRVWCPPD